MDPVVLQTIWGVGRESSPIYSTSPAPSSGYNAALWAVRKEKSDAARIPISVQRGTLIVDRQAKLTDVGFSWVHSKPAPRGVAGIYNRRGGDLYIPEKTRQDIDLGRGFELKPLAAGPGEHTQTVVVTQAGTTHTLKFDLMAGGIVDSWDFNGTELLNRGGTLNRGLQAGAYFADSAPLGNELRSYAPRQGGNRYSEDADISYFFGGILLSLTVTDEPSGGVSITTVTVPTDYDPEGGLIGTPGIQHGFGGGQKNPVLWDDLTITQKLWINHNGQLNAHKLTTTLDASEAFVGAYIDMDLASALFLDADALDEVWSYDSVVNLGLQLSNGVVGNPNYQAEYRVYSMNRAAIVGDDEPPPYGGSFIPSGKGCVAAVNAAQTLAVGVATDEPATDDLVSADRTMGDQITGWRWAQNRAVASGRDGKGTVLLSAGSFLTGRFHPTLSVRRVPKGSASCSVFILTDTWANVKTLTDSLLD